MICVPTEGAFLTAACNFAAHGFAAFQEQFARTDLLAGRRVRVASGAQTYEGVAAGVDERGALRVREAGTLRVFDSAEVTVRAQ